MPSLRALEMLVAVADTSSITEAARRLHLTQPAVSHQLARLEQEAGVRLLDRGRRGVTLTPEGRAVVEHARHAVGAARRAMTIAHASRPEVTIRIAVAESFTVPFLAPVISGWHAPGRAALEVAEITSVDAALDALANGEHDIVVVPGPVSAPGLHVEALGVEEVVAVMGQRPPDSAGQTSLANLASVVTVGVDASNGFRDWIAARFAEHGAVYGTDVTTRSLPNAAAIAAAGLGTAVVPISATVPGMPVVSLQPRLLRHVVAVTRARPTGATAALLELLGERIPDLIAR